MNPWKGIKGLPKNIWLISAASLINRIGTMVLPFLALYVTTTLKKDPTEAGLVIAVYGLGSFVTAPFAGRLSDKLGELTLMKISLIGSGIFLFIISQITDYYLLLIIMPLWAAINEAFRPASLAFISNETTSAQRKTGFALYRLAVNLGMSIGPAVGGILSGLDFSLLFYVDGITCLVAGGFLIFTKWELREKIEHETPPEIHGKTFFAVLKNKPFFIFLLLYIPIQIVYMQSLSTLPIYIVNDLGFTNAIFGMVIAVNTVIIILIEVPLNSSMSNWRNRNSLIVGAVLTGIGFGLTAIAFDLPILITTVVIWTFGEMIFFPAAASYASELSPSNKRGEYMGYFQMTFSFSFIAAPYLGTAVYENFGSVILWVSAFAFTLITVVLLLFVDKAKTVNK